MSERIGKYLIIEPSEHQPRSGMTKRWNVLTNHGDCLGQVSWFGRWRQYTFSPSLGTTFNRDCLMDIAIFLERINNEHRQSKLWNR